MAVTLLVVGAAGALGAVSRYVAGVWLHGIAGDSFPWGTLGVNVAGCLALGFAVVWLHATAASTELRTAVTAGFLGSFTTFSTFSYEAVALLREGAWGRAGGYVLGSVAVGLLAVVAGMALAQALVESRY